jgi:hypothetical protein
LFARLRLQAGVTELFSKVLNIDHAREVPPSGDAVSHFFIEVNTANMQASDFLV